MPGGGKSHVLLQMTTRTPVFFKIKIFCTSSDLEKSNSNKDPPTSLLINTRFCRAPQKLCFNCNSLKKSQKVFLCSVCTLIKKANKAQEGKVEDQEEAQALGFGHLGGYGTGAEADRCSESAPAGRETGARTGNP